MAKDTKAKKPKPSSPRRTRAEPQNPQQINVDEYKSLLMTYADNVHEAYVADTRQIETYVMKVAGLGATVGGYLLVSGSKITAVSVRIPLATAVILCILAGVSTGISLIYARKRGESVTEATDGILSDLTQGQELDLADKLAAVERHRAKHDCAIGVWNNIAITLAFLGVISFCVATIAAVTSS